MFLFFKKESLPSYPIASRHGTCPPPPADRCQAAEACQQAIRIQPSLHSAWFKYGVVNFQLENFLMALECVRAARALRDSEALESRQHRLELKCARAVRQPALKLAGSPKVMRAAR